MSKKSIRFFNDREVRAVWDDANNKWWFSATDIVRAINDEEDYVKAGNYWRWLKRKLNTDGVQLVSVTHKFKFQAPDGKQRNERERRWRGELLYNAWQAVPCGPAACPCSRCRGGHCASAWSPTCIMLRRTRTGTATSASRGRNCGMPWRRSIARGWTSSSSWATSRT